MIEKYTTTLSKKKNNWSIYHHEIKRHLLFVRKTMTNLDSILKSRNITLLTKVHLVKAMVFSVVMYGCESWTIKKAEHRRIDAFELWCWRILESPLNCKEIKLVNPKGNKSWIFIGRTDTEAEAPILWPPDAKSQFIGKDPGARQEEKGTAEVGWHHWLNGHEFEQALGVSDGQGSLTCCSPCGHKSWTQLRDWTELNRYTTQGDGLPSRTIRTLTSLSLMLQPPD